MIGEAEEVFPPVDELRERRWHRAQQTVGRIQTIARMAQEFAHKMAELGCEAQEYPFISGNPRGFVIPLTYADLNGELVDGLCFVGVGGYVADYSDGRVGTPHHEALDSDEMVDAYRVAMLAVLSGIAGVVAAPVQAHDGTEATA
jgi:hypothetical protein